MAYPEITMSTKTIHNPENPRHFMRAKGVARKVRILHQGRIIAESLDALRVTEVATDVIDPVLYLPPSDVRATLQKIEDNTTHCPLKGDASYYALEEGEAPIAWIYHAPYEFATILKDRIAFYPDKVVVEEIGSDA